MARRVRVARWDRKHQCWPSPYPESCTNSSGSPSNSGVSYSASDRRQDCVWHQLHHFAFRQRSLRPHSYSLSITKFHVNALDSLFHECPFYLEPTTTTYSVPLIIASASCCWINLILFNLYCPPYSIYSSPFCLMCTSLPPQPLSPCLLCYCRGAVIIHLREQNHRHCLSCYPFPMGINRFNSW